MLKVYKPFYEHAPDIKAGAFHALSVGPAAQFMDQIHKTQHLLHSSIAYIVAHGHGFSILKGSEQRLCTNGISPVAEEA